MFLNLLSHFSAIRSLGIACILAETISALIYFESLATCPCRVSLWDAFPEVRFLGTGDGAPSFGTGAAILPCQSVVQPH